MNESIMEFNSSPNSEGKSLNLFDVVKKKLSDEKQEWFEPGFEAGNFEPLTIIFS